MHNLFPWFFIPSNGIAGDQTSKRSTNGDCCCSFSLLPCWRRSSSPIFFEKNNDDHNIFQPRHDADIHNNVYQHDAFEVMSKCIKDVLILQQGRGECDDDILDLSKGLVSALLLESDSYDGDRDIDVNAIYTNDYEKMDSDIAPTPTNEESTEDHLEGRAEDRFLILKGIPRRPYYQELSRRILLLHRHYNNNMLDMGITNEKAKLLERNVLKPQLRTFPRPLIAADELGLSEINTSSKIHCLPQESITISNCTQWLNMIKEEGIRELLGLRTTIGTEIRCFPPDITHLIDAANQPITNKPNAKPPILTVAGRARAKHSHRGEIDQFFGVSRGNNIEKNEAAVAIVKDMIRDAAWINIHVFGTVEAPIMEVRNTIGYGARWSADWNINNGEWSKPSDVVFRGFLEPQMDEGFEKRWRH